MMAVESAVGIGLAVAERPVRATQPGAGDPDDVARDDEEVSQHGRQGCQAAKAQAFGFAEHKECIVSRQNERGQ
jgi:hypothetical protein